MNDILLEAGDIVAVHAGTTLFRIVGLDGDLAEVVPVGGGGLPATVHVNHLRRIDARVVPVRTPDDFRQLSYYTLCKLQDATPYANPIHGLPKAIERGEYEGMLIVDQLGNFIDFS